MCVASFGFLSKIFLMFELKAEINFVKQI